MFTLFRRPNCAYKITCNYVDTKLAKIYLSIDNFAKSISSPNLLIKIMFDYCLKGISSCLRPYLIVTSFFATKTLGARVGHDALPTLNAAQSDSWSPLAF